MSNPFRDFAIEKVVKHTSPLMMRDYFKYKGLLDGLDFESSLEELRKKLGQKEYGKAVTQKFSEITISKLLEDFHIVHLLSKREAYHFLIANMNMLGVEELEKLQSYKNCHDKVFWLLINLDEQVRQVFLIYCAKTHPAKYWCRRDDYLPANIKLDDATLDKLSSAVSDYLKNETRGGQVLQR